MTKSKVLKRIFAFVMITTMLLAMSATAFADTKGPTNGKATSAADEITYNDISGATAKTHIVVHTDYAGETFGVVSICQDEVDTATGKLTGKRIWADTFTAYMGSAYWPATDLGAAVDFTQKKFSDLTPDANYESAANHVLTKDYNTDYSAGDNKLSILIDNYIKYIKSGTYETVDSDANGDVICDYAGREYYIFFGAGSTDNVRVYQNTVVNTLTYTSETTENKGQQVIRKNYEINAKSSLPVVEKTVTGTAGDATPKEDNDNTVSVGDELTYTISATVPVYAGFVANDNANDNPVFYMQDTLSSGLTLTSTEIKPKADGTELPAAAYKTVINGNTFQIFFNFDSSEVKDATQLTASYKAVVNENAVVGAPGNPNDYKLTYSNNQEKVSKWDEIPTDKTGLGTLTDKRIVYTYGLQILKVDAGDNTKKLAGAVFEVYKNYNETTKEFSNKLGTITTDANGLGVFNGVGANNTVLWLKETKAPTDYNATTDGIKVTVALTEKITTTTTIKYTTVSGDANIKPAIQAVNNAGEKLYLPVGSDDDAVPVTTATGNLPAYIKSITYTKVSEDTGNNDYTAPVEVPNSQYLALPSTGGIGTTLFYIFGGLMVVGAGIVLITKKRMANSEN